MSQGSRVAQAYGPPMAAPNRSLAPAKVFLSIERSFIPTSATNHLLVGLAVAALAAGLRGDVDGG